MKKGSSKIDKQVQDFIIKNYPEKSALSINKLIKEKYGLEYSNSTISYFLKREGLLVRRKPYTTEMEMWIKENYMNYQSFNSFYDDFQKTFNTKKKITALGDKTRALGITHFKQFSGSKKGERKANRKNIGDITIKDGVAYIKVADEPVGRYSACHKKNTNWEIRSHKVYKDYHGEIPKGYHIVHIDGNTLNDDIDNLIAVPQGVKGTIGIEFGKVEDKDAYRTLLKLKTLEQNIKKGTYGK